jgi:hypothetical protein
LVWHHINAIQQSIERLTTAMGNSQGSVAEAIIDNTKEACGNDVRSPMSAVGAMKMALGLEFDRCETTIYAVRRATIRVSEYVIVCEHYCKALESGNTSYIHRLTEALNKMTPSPALWRDSSGTIQAGYPDMRNIKYLKQCVGDAEKCLTDIDDKLAAVDSAIHTLTLRFHEEQTLFKEWMQWMESMSRIPGRDTGAMSSDGVNNGIKMKANAHLEMLAEVKNAELNLRERANELDDLIQDQRRVLRV